MSILKLLSNRKVIATGTVLTATGLTAIVYKEYYAGGPKYEIKGDLSDVVAIVTGATSGIGKATAERLAKKQARVILACRDIEACKEVRRKIVLDSRNRNVLCRQCDLSSMESVKAFAARMLKDEKKINLLINNAATKQTKIRKITEDGFEMHLGVNFLGHFLLTMLLMDRLKESGPSRIVNVSDISYSKAHINFDDLNSTNDYERKRSYDQSKLALVAFSNQLAEILKGSNVTVNAVYPGMAYTQLDRRERFAKNWFFRFFRYMLLRTEKQASRSITYAATSPELVDITGQYIQDCETKQQVGEATDNKVRLRLWLTSEKWTQLNEAKNDVLARVTNAIAEENAKKTA